MIWLRRLRARQRGRLARCALIVVTVPAVLFSSMGVNVALPRPMDVAPVIAAAAVGVCSSCSGGMCMMTPGQSCTCPMCAMRHPGRADATAPTAANRSMAAHGSSPTEMCAAAMPCSAPARWLLMMTQLGWDVPSIFHVDPIRESVLAEPIRVRSVNGLFGLSLDPPPPRLCA